MQDDWEQLDGCWRRKQELRNGATVFVMRSDRFFEDSETLDVINGFFKALDQTVVRSLQTAIESPYINDIAQCGGINLNCVQWQSCGAYQIWFSLGFHPDRMLAVKFLADNPVDVYCDAP